MEKKMPYHLTITNNETGEIERDLDFDALIGAVHLSERESAGIFLADSTILAQAEVLDAAEDTVKQALAEDPMLRMATYVVKAEAAKAVTDTEGTENK